MLHRSFGISTTRAVSDMSPKAFSRPSITTTRRFGKQPTS
jgi:hypothetical protein